MLSDGETGFNLYSVQSDVNTAAESDELGRLMEPDVVHLTTR